MIAVGGETEGALASDGAELAWRRRSGAGPTVLWLGGFQSEMTGTKAQALDVWARDTGRTLVRFDYFGHGASEGRFEAGTISRWRADALAILDTLTRGPVILVGSSMGGWLACLVAMARPRRVRGLVLVAPAADFTERLVRPSLSPRARLAIADDGVWRAPSRYEASGYPISRGLLEDGARWSILPGPVAVKAPARILHGGRDRDVPWTLGLELAQAIRGQDVVFTLIRDGDHRLRRAQDIARIVTAIEEVSAPGVAR